LSVLTPAVSERQGALIPARVVFAVVAFLSLLHLLAAGRIALSVDEAHYALYGPNPDWSYCDHPPLVGWLQALVLTISRSELALRFWPVVLAALSSALLYRLTRLLFPEESPWTAVVAVGLLQSAVLFQVVSMALVPEDLLLFLGLAGVLAFHRMVHAGDRRSWLWLGLCLGLAGLSKYTAVLLPASMIAVLAVERRLGMLAKPAPWLSAAVAVALVAPVFWWNIQHDWISFSYQWNHGAPDRHWSSIYLLRSGAAQLLAYGPMLVLFGTIAALSAVRHWRTHEGQRFLLLLAAPVFLIFFITAGFQDALPHWTLLGWALLAPLAARWIVQHWRSVLVKAVAALGLIYSLVLALAIHAQFLHPWLPFKPYQHPLTDLYGWREAAVRAAELRGDAMQPLMVMNWTQASRIAWYAGAPVVVLDRGVDQFDLWFGTPAKGANGLLVVTEEQHKRVIGVINRFEECTTRDHLPTLVSGTPVHTFYFYDCRGYRGNP
jgi:4-amino-4-deoxy-L-arabinose transferase-like glycosyltransferase